jgi:hypothetical protein
VDDAQDEVSSIHLLELEHRAHVSKQLSQMKTDIAKRADKAKLQDVKYREMPDIVVKVICRYRAELFFKISRKTKLSRLFNAWTDRMEKTGGKKSAASEGKGVGTVGESAGSTNGPPNTDAPGVPPPPTMQFIFTHNGRSIGPDQSPEDAGMEDGDEILAVELMDLTEGPEIEDWVSEASPFVIDHFKAL